MIRPGSIFAVLIIIIFAATSGVSQESDDLEPDSSTIEVPNPTTEEGNLLGEELKAIDALSWERQSTPISLTQTPSRTHEMSPDDPVFQRSSRSTSYFAYLETSVARSRGGTTMPSDSLLLGSPLSTTARFQIRPAQGCDAHLVVAKQAGEKLGDAALRGSLEYHPGSALHAILGDYVVNVADGLVLSGNRASIGEGTTRAADRRHLLSPFFGTGTMGFLRGAAVALRKRIGGGMGCVVLCCSRRSLAASTREDGTVRSIDWTGYERTDLEVQKQARLHESVFAARCSWETGGGSSLGMTMAASSYDRRIQPESGLGFTGDGSKVLGLDLEAHVGRAVLCSECARSFGGSLSFVARAEIKPALGSTFVILLRSYGTDFSNPHACAFGRHSDGANEQGAFVGFSCRPVPSLGFDGSADLYRYPSRSSTSVFPASGGEAGLRATLECSNGVNLSGRLRARHGTEQRLVESGQSNECRRDVVTDLVSFTGVLRVPLARNLSMHCRVSTVSNLPDCGLTSSHGSLLGLDMRWDSPAFHMTCAYNQFSTETYDAAVYVVEPSAANGLTAWTCYGAGSRWSLSAGWKPWQASSISMRLGSTVCRWKPSSTGSGPVLYPPEQMYFLFEISSFL